MGLTWDSCRIVGGEVHFETVGKVGRGKVVSCTGWTVRRIAETQDGQPLRVCGLQSAGPRSIHLMQSSHRRQAGHRGVQPRQSRQVVRAAALPLVKNRCQRDEPRSTFSARPRFSTPGGERTSTIKWLGTHGSGRRVMMRHYVKETDPERRNASNRTFYRIAASLAPETADAIRSPDCPGVTSGTGEGPPGRCQAKDWLRVSQLSAELGNRAG